MKRDLEEIEEEMRNFLVTPVKESETKTGNGWTCHTQNMTKAEKMRKEKSKSGGERGGSTRCRASVKGLLEASAQSSGPVCAHCTQSATAPRFLFNSIFNYHFQCVLHKKNSGCFVGCQECLLTKHRVLKVINKVEVDDKDWLSFGERTLRARIAQPGNAPAGSIFGSFAPHQLFNFMSN